MSNEKQAREAFNKIKEQYPQEATILSNYIKGLQEQNVAALGDNEVFALQGPNGEINCFKQQVRLSAEDGTLVQPVSNGPFVISAQGYEVLAEKTGTNVIFPGHVLVDGQWQVNPYVARDPNNRRILSIYARAIAFKYSPTGVPQIADWTTIFDLPSYRLIDLLGKAKAYPQAFKLLPADQKPENDGSGTWAKYPFDESTSLWVNTSHNEALQWYSQILNREKKAMDFAQTFARRNATKHLLGLQKAPGKEWNLTVYCWRSNDSLMRWDGTAYQNLQKQLSQVADGGELPKGTGEVIDMSTGTSRMEEETDMVATEDAMDEPTEDNFQAAEPEPTQDMDEPPFESESEPEQPQEEAADPEQTTNSVELSEEDKRTMANFQEALDQFPEEVKEACQVLNISQGTSDPGEAAQIMGKMHELMDA